MRALLLTALLALPAAAQDREGNDTAGAWVNTHQARFGGWDSLCDARDTEVRCYLRYVDVYRPRPNFGALFAFVETTPDAFSVSLGLEFGTDFGPGTLTAFAGTTPVWKLAPDTCDGTAPCRLEDTAAIAMTDALTTAQTLEVTFTDQYGDPQIRRWNTAQFAAALADHRAAAQANGLTAAN